MIPFFILLFEGDRYVIETDGLLIKNVDYEDAGTYTCRARVLETGSLEERDIKLEVIIFVTSTIVEQKVQLCCDSDSIIFWLAIYHLMNNLTLKTPLISELLWIFS